ncbi:MAG: hypothetical protein ACLT1B_11985 [Anaerobutyricum hallii]
MSKTRKLGANPEFISKLIQTALQKGLLLENAGSFGNVIRFLAIMYDGRTDGSWIKDFWGICSGKFIKSSIYKIKKRRKYHGI